MIYEYIFYNNYFTFMKIVLCSQNSICKIDVHILFLFVENTFQNKLLDMFELTHDCQNQISRCNFGKT